MANFSLTITGADDQVDPIDLDALGQVYPFVEWGILFSGTKQGQPRYPTKSWREQLYGITFDREDSGYHMAAHLCDEIVNTRLASFDMFESEIEKNFDVVQFNNFNGLNYSAIQRYAKHYLTTHQVIVPFNKITETIILSSDPEFKETLSILCDSSGGKGIACKAWPDNIPEDFLERQAVGYAGGINEHNIEAVLEGLTQFHGSHFFWIDLETGARDEKDRFDIEKVNRILELADQFLEFNDIEIDEIEEFEEEVQIIPEHQLPELIIIR